MYRNLNTTQEDMTWLRSKLLKTHMIRCWWLWILEFWNWNPALLSLHLSVWLLGAILVEKMVRLYAAASMWWHNKVMGRYGFSKFFATTLNNRNVKKFRKKLVGVWPKLQNIINKNFFIRYFGASYWFLLLFRPKKYPSTRKAEVQMKK